MKAITNRIYGSTDVLKLEDVKKPIVKGNQVLIKVKAASINSWDWDFLSGKMFTTRIAGPFKPQYKILGADVSGIVESVGPMVSILKIGDEVYGDISENGWGGFAEYVAVPETVLAIKPKSLSFIEAASIPQAGSLALQGLRDKRKIKMGDRVLVNGGGGGVGMFAIQIAKSYGAIVTGVDSEFKMDKMKKAGADFVIDYQQQDYTKDGDQYDLILDMVATRTFPDYKRSLKIGGNFVMIGGAMGVMLRTLILGPSVLEKEKKDLSLLLYKPSPNDLDEIANLISDGIIVSVVDKVFPLSETSNAFRHFEDGYFVGKVVIIVDG